MDLKTLKTSSIAVFDGMVAHYPQYQQDEPIFVAGMLSKFNDRVYTMNNSTISYISEGQFYVTPYTRDAMAALREEGFRDAGLYVPFSNGDYPRDAQERWEELWRDAKASYKAYREQECSEMSAKRGIGVIAKLDRFFCIPDEGMTVRYPQGHIGFHYALCSDGMGSCGYEYLGKFCRNNGVVIFVHHDGRTYLAKGYKVIQELLEAGYVESSFMVPMSNNEVIEDGYLQRTWESIRKNPI